MTTSADNPAASGRRFAGPVVFVGVALVVGAAAALIWGLSKTPRPETKPSVSEEMQPGDWTWADGAGAGSASTESEDAAPQGEGDRGSADGASSSRAPR